jgi:multiple sugar transport system substrate-binding protein
VTVPVRKKTDRYPRSEKLVACLSSADNLLSTDSTLSYVAPTRAVQDKQVATSPDLAVWVRAVQVAKGRTSGGLGTRYPKISQPMWGAVQAALSGSRTPRQALSAAQQSAAAATK